MNGHWSPVGFLDPHVDRFVMTMTGEKKIIEIHKHWIVLFWPTIRLCLAVVVLILALRASGGWFYFVWFLGFILGYQAVWQIMADYRDRFMITTIRLFRAHGVLATQRAAIPISRLVDITVLRPTLGRWLNYGHFKFESAAQIQGLYRISFVKDIDEVENILYTVISGDVPAEVQAMDDGT
jgi:membrane protein YdbS with pleckstrin-like domain